MRREVLFVCLIVGGCAESVGNSADPAGVEAADPGDAAPPLEEAGPDSGVDVRDGGAPAPEDAGDESVVVCSPKRECDPGTTRPCGHCGKRTCSDACTWEFQCKGETGACEPGATDYSAAGCPAGAFHKKTCDSSCAWGVASGCGDPDPNVMTIAPNVGGVVSAVWRPADGDKGRRADGVCGGAILSPTDDYTRVRVAIANTTSKSATVTIYQSQAPGGAELDLVMWLYTVVDPPTDDASLAACSRGVADECDTPGLANPCGNTTDRGFAGLRSVGIPPSGRVFVYSAGWGPDVEGPFKLNVRTDAVN